MCVCVCVCNDDNTNRFDVVGSHEESNVVTRWEPAHVVLKGIVAGVPVLEAAVAKETLDHVLDAEIVEAGLGEIGRLLRHGGGPLLE